MDEGSDTPKRLHAAVCQIKVFKLKGADRKHKQDREKIMKRPPSEQEKYQPSYECTVLSDVSIAFKHFKNNKERFIYFCYRLHVMLLLLRPLLSERLFQQGKWCCVHNISVHFISTLKMFN